LIVLIIGTKILCANLGCNRAFLVRELSEDMIMTIPLSREHIANQPDEQLRVKKGLSRGFGYFGEKGVIATPEVMEMDLTKFDRYIVMANHDLDMDPERINELIMPFYRLN